MKLLSPFSVASLKLKNRVVMPPMCMYKAEEDGEITDFHLTHYGARAIGGVGLIIVEATAVEARGRISDNDLGLWDDEHIAGHQKLVTLCQSLGSKMAIQLAHAGRKSLCEKSTPVAPSSLLFSESGGFKLPHALHVNEIQTLKTTFVEAAVRAQEAGYDMIELHAAHGYLLFEFLSPLTNQRTDTYGGSLINRCKLVLEICQAILEATEIPLMVRVSGDEWCEGGWNINDTLYLTKELKALGVSCMHLSSGGNHAIQPLMPELKPFYQSHFAKVVKEKVNIPTIAVGLITTAAEGESLLENGTCDLVAYGRELLRNPNFIFFSARDAGEKELIESAYMRAF